jgi:hypothetical protein
VSASYTLATQLLRCGFAVLGLDHVGERASG